MPAGGIDGALLQLGEAFGQAVLHLGHAPCDAALQLGHAACGLLLQLGLQAQQVIRSALCPTRAGSGTGADSFQVQCSSRR